MRGTRGQRLSSVVTLYLAVPHPSRLRRATFPQRGKAKWPSSTHRISAERGADAEDDPNRRHQDQTNSKEPL